MHACEATTPHLINAVRSNDLDVVRLLLEQGADPNLKGDYDSRLGADRTPLNQARNGSDVVDLLIAGGCQQLGTDFLDPQFN